jgi:hypothetical protein
MMNKRKYIVKSLRRFAAARPHRRLARAGLTVLLLLVYVAPSLFAADQKLILTDGSDQIVRSYEVIGNRVRYFSAERMEWEEIPSDLVDWKATEAAKQAAELALEEARAKAAEVKPRVVLDAAGTSPRLLMPDQEGVYVLSVGATGDTRRAGLKKLSQAQGIVENNKKRSLLSLITPVPIVKGKATILLPGKSSSTQVQPAATAIYIMLAPAEKPEPDAQKFPPAGAKPTADGQSEKSQTKKEQAASLNLKQAPSAASAFSLVRLKTKGNERVVGEITFSPIGGSMSETRDVVPAKFEMAFPAQVDADGDSLPVVWKLTPWSPLPPGEYAIVEFVDHERQNLFVWDFGVGGSGPVTK